MNQFELVAINSIGLSSSDCQTIAKICSELNQVNLAKKMVDLSTMLKSQEEMPAAGVQLELPFK